MIKTVSFIKRKAEEYKNVLRTIENREDEDLQYHFDETRRLTRTATTAH